MYIVGASDWEKQARKLYVYIYTYTYTTYYSIISSLSHSLHLAYNIQQRTPTTATAAAIDLPAQARCLYLFCARIPIIYIRIIYERVRVIGLGLGLVDAVVPVKYLWQKAL